LQLDFDWYKKLLSLLLMLLLGKNLH